jgi:hypothetical protein
MLQAARNWRLQSSRSSPEPPPPEPLRERRLNREPDRDRLRSIKYFEDVIANEAAVFALTARPGIQLDAPIASAAFKTGKVWFLHPRSPDKVQSLLTEDVPAFHMPVKFKFRFQRKLDSKRSIPISARSHTACSLETAWATRLGSVRRAAKWLTIRTEMALDEALKRWRHIITGKTKAAHNLPRDIVRDIFRPTLGSVEGYDANGVVVLTGDQIGDRGFQIGPIFAGLKDFSATPWTTSRIAQSGG